MHHKAVGASGLKLSTWPHHSGPPKSVAFAPAPLSFEKLNSELKTGTYAALNGHFS